MSFYSLVPRSLIRPMTNLLGERTYSAAVLFMTANLECSGIYANQEIRLNPKIDNMAII
jgi:hypothetical protein